MGSLFRAAALAAAVAAAGCAPPPAEGIDWNVVPVSYLKGEPYRAPTPQRIPGGGTLSTAQLAALLDAPAKPLLINAMAAGDESLPGAVRLSGAGQAGTFHDDRQIHLAERLAKLTAGDRHRTMVFFARDAESWLAYNAALRAMELGYTNVHWYRGGLEAWRAAGRPIRLEYEDLW